MFNLGFISIFIKYKSTKGAKEAQPKLSGKMQKATPNYKKKNEKNKNQVLNRRIKKS